MRASAEARSGRRPGPCVRAQAKTVLEQTEELGVERHDPLDRRLVHPQERAAGARWSAEPPCGGSPRAPAPKPPAPRRGSPRRRPVREEFPCRPRGARRLRGGPGAGPGAAGPVAGVRAKEARARGRAARIIRLRFSLNRKTMKRRRPASSRRDPGACGSRAPWPAPKLRR